MDGENKENEAVKKQVRMGIPESVHERVVKYQAKLIGRRGQKVTFADACVDILDRATRSMK